MQTTIQRMQAAESARVDRLAEEVTKEVADFLDRVGKQEMGRDAESQLKAHAYWAAADMVRKHTALPVMLRELLK